MIELREIAYQSSEYEQMLGLRTEVLRKPLGLTFTQEQLEKESADYLIGAFDLGTLLGCCILSPSDSVTIQLRQMAVDPEVQRQGIGQQVVAFAENLAQSNQFKTVMLHARIPAVPFYEKLGYRRVGEAFVEVGISHFQMEKTLVV